ncbi:DNA primase [Leucobacter rhizosphaerae]|uniref:DNA primase n=1 Tax=Leucobacter rhizosphaerae TaxID=2932245 RepID=A0ABY4FXA2_9MICO|nr:DNA primase [Leucobacter rhizosphaerae]UOQ60927.1 DNA primase [Leucobacter rhizosphaerae]
MAGRIRASDIEEVKRRSNLADLVGDYVTLKNAGIDSMKGLCPFHDERSPSFHVRPALGYYHCFGCGESGDAFTFLQRMDHLTFAESVERLAARIHYVLTYEEGNFQREEGPNRARLLAANEAAAKFYVDQLASDEGAAGRAFLDERGFDAAAGARFGVGYAPRGWDALTKHLRTQGYTPQELALAGLVSEGQRGVYDRFRGRVVWPIRDTSGQTLGFGARRLYDDDQGPKYLNTPESPVYHKSQVLYGLDVAKRAISRGHRAVVVEGYTDVMACHLAGIETAVATCGTAFGKDHIAVLRRIMGDDSAAEVVFTFDPDEAGQKAALRAFSEERRFTAQTYVAVAPEGLDPCDLRLHRGDEAVRELFTRKVPLFEFALRQAIGRFDLNSVEGRVSALRAAAPIIAEIKDPSLRPGYTRELARMLGIELGEVQQAVRSAERQPRGSGSPQGAGSQGRGAPRGGSGPGRGAQGPDQRRDPASNRAPARGPGRAGGDGSGDPSGDPYAEFSPDGPDANAAPPRITLSALRQTPTTWLERDALMAMLQQGDSVGPDLLQQAVTAQVLEPNLRVVREAIAAALPHLGEPGWLDAVQAAAPPTHHELVRELAMAPMPQRKPEQLAAYSRDVVVSLLDRDLISLKSELLARLQRIGDHTDPASRRIQEQLVALEAARRGLREE